MALYLSCGLCGRKQAEGLLSRAHWGHTESRDGGALRACPTCKQEHSDWENRLLHDGNVSGFATPTAAAQPSFSS
jgi:hypothetical protein